MRAGTIHVINLTPPGSDATTLLFGPKSRTAIRKNRGVVTANSSNDTSTQPALPVPPARSTSYGTRKVVAQPTAPPAGVVAAAGPGGAVQAESSWTHSLKAPGFIKPLNLKCDILVSKFAFEWFNLYRYALAPS
jgi:hypothetical protein